MNRKMPTANYDASRVTQRMRSAVMYAGKLATDTAVNAGQSVRREQPDTQMNELLAYRNMAKAFTTPVVNNVTGCACSQDVVENSGGNNANNVQ